MARLDVKFSESKMKINAGFNESSTELKAVFGNFYGVTEQPPDAEIYTGQYNVTPKPEAQSLNTAQKLMTDDVTIKSIPYYDVSNTAGGRTVFIGKEIE